MDELKPNKSPHAEREERILASWKEKGIFEKSLEKNKGKGKDFLFYEGPPTANGRPGIHHLEARAFKDAIPRYKTMRGFYVRRKGGWDTHGLPVELQVEKELGLKSKKEIEQYGIGAFNDKCKESVWKYVHEWEGFTDRMGYWVDLKNPYITYKPEYIESVWNVIKTVGDKGLLYKDYKVVPWCPRCGTALSSHELAQGYQDVKDLAVTVKFRINNQKAKGKNESQNSKVEDTYLLAWTTTPWTLPGNVGLAVNSKIEYVKIKVEDDGFYILAKSRLAVLKDTKYSTVETMKGSELVGMEYEPLYPFLKDNISGPEKEKLGNAYKVYAADFVTTEDGTGIVHTAVMYGQDDFELGTKVGLPKYHLVNEDGTFKKEAGFLAGAFVKDPGTDVAIIKDLAGRGLLFAKEKYEHSYPFCWRCHTPLIYFARDSWYIKMSALRNDLVKENEGIHWEPGHIKEGRFGEWLSEVKDWAISRERYWGTPLPVWSCEKCKKIKVVGSKADVSQKPKNSYSIMRHGQAENNTLGIISDKPEYPHHLTDLGRQQVAETAESLKGSKFDLIFVSPFVRTMETTQILKGKLGWKDEQIHVDSRIHEVGVGDWSGRKVADTMKEFKYEDRFERCPKGGETYADVKKRMGDFLYDLESKYEGKKILIISHETPLFLLVAVAKGLDRKQSLDLRGDKEYIANAQEQDLDFEIIPHNSEYELDLHRPFIDEVKLACECGGTMNRAKEVLDVWFDSGSMPFSQDHYPFENKELINGKGYPADFISEAIDQTRGWFYTLHAIGILMGKGKAFKNVICLGHILDAKGKKMSKSIGNVVNPWEMMDKYGADALRFWMYSVNQPGDSKNFEEKTVDEIVKKVFNLAANVLSFYKLYEDDEIKNQKSKIKNTDKKVKNNQSQNVLDQWIVARLNQLISTITKGLDGYIFMEPARAIRDFMADLSQWYLRRSRDRFKEEGEDKEQALATTRFILITLAKVMAPFTPFFADYLYEEAGGGLESVHLENWPEASEIDISILKDMETVRYFSSKGLEARSLARINVRQPLKTFHINEYKSYMLKHDSNGSNKVPSSEKISLSEDMVNLIRDEVNVKNVLFDSTIEEEVKLDLIITPELKEEGDLRELLRKIQDLRKEKGLTVGDLAVLMVTDEFKAIVTKNGDAIKKATNLKSIEFGAKLEIK